MLPWEGCRDAGRGGGMPGNASSSRCSQPRLLGLCSLLSPPSSPQGCSPTSAPSACPEQEPISPVGGEHGSQIGLASPWGPTQHPRGDSRTRPLPRPPAQGPLASWSPTVPTPPLPCAAAPRHRGHREGAPGGCFSHGTPSPKPCSARSSGRLHRLKMAKAARGSPDSRGVQPSFRGTKAQTKITQDNAEELFVPARGRGQAPARPHSRFFRASHPPPAAASTFRLRVLLISFPPRRDVLELVLHSLLPPEPLQGRGRVKPPGFRSFFGVCSCWGRQVSLPGAHRPHGAGAPRVPLLLWGHWGPEMSFPSLLEV